MRNKIIGILICTLFIGTSFIPNITGISIEDKNFKNQDTVKIQNINNLNNAKEKFTKLLKDTNIIVDTSQINQIIDKYLNQLDIANLSEPPAFYLLFFAGFGFVIPIGTHIPILLHKWLNINSPPIGFDAAIYTFGVFPTVLVPLLFTDEGEFNGFGEPGMCLYPIHMYQGFVGYLDRITFGGMIGPITIGVGLISEFDYRIPW